MSYLGDAEDEPVTFLSVRLLAGVLAVVVVGTGVVGDPLWLSLSLGLAVGGAFAGTSLLLRRIAG